jgi:peptidyl-prolyl cis-trans isomerase SurA
MKRTFVFILLCSLGKRPGTDCFHLRKKAVSKDEFLKAYHKNSAAAGDSAQKISEYLDLYIKFKLKVQAALDSRMDTLPLKKLTC